MTETRIDETADGIHGISTFLPDLFGATWLTPATGPTIRRLAQLTPTTLALMHGPAFTGDTAGALLALADDYDRRLTRSLEERP